MTTAFSLPKAFASVSGMGAPTAWHPVRRWIRLGSLVTFLILLLLAVLILSYGLFDAWQASQAHGPALIDDRLFMPLLLSLLVFLLSLVAAWITYSRWNRGVAVYEHGFAHRDRRGVQAWRWEQVTALSAAVTRHFPGGDQTGTSRTYTLRDLRGGTLLLTDQLKDVEGLARAIEEAVFPHLYDQCASRYNRGEEVSFGAVTVSKSGITLGRKEIPWTEVGQVSIEHGTLRVARKSGGWFSGAGAAAAQIPNLRVLLSMIDQVAGVKTD